MLFTSTLNRPNRAFTQLHSRYHRLGCQINFQPGAAFRLEFARHPPDANPVLFCDFYCPFKKSSSVIALFKNTPVLFPVDTAYDTARIGLVLSPQANILSTVVF